MAEKEKYHVEYCKDFVYDFMRVGEWVCQCDHPPQKILQHTCSYVGKVFLLTYNLLKWLEAGRGLEKRLEIVKSRPYQCKQDLVMSRQKQLYGSPSLVRGGRHYGPALFPCCAHCCPAVTLCCLVLTALQSAVHVSVSVIIVLLHISAIKHV